MKIRFWAVLLCCALLMTLFSSCTGKSDMLKECGEDVISKMVEMLEKLEDEVSFEELDSGDIKICGVKYKKK